MLSIETCKTRGTVKVHPEGSVFLCYADVDLTVTDVAGMDPNEPFVLTIPGLIVRINKAGEPSVQFPTREWVDADSGKTRRARVFSPANKESYDKLVSLVFAHPAIDRRVSKALVLIEAGAQEEAAA